MTLSVVTGPGTAPIIRIPPTAAITATPGTAKSGKPVAVPMAAPTAIPAVMLHPSSAAGSKIPFMSSSGEIDFASDRIKISLSSWSDHS